LLAGARGFYLSLFERVFHVKILCLRAVISFSFFVIAYRFYNTSYRAETEEQKGKELIDVSVHANEHW
jgi:hypothetical protein